MPDFLQSLISADALIETGIIEKYLGNGKYEVMIRGRSLSVRSAVDQFFVNGTCVVINRVTNSRYIVGVTAQFDIRTRKEVVIDA